MPKFRKKPVVIEARQWFPKRDSVVVDISNWLARNGARFTVDNATTLRIQTLESNEHTVSPRDWVIQGVAGEFYACKPDVFEATYEPA